MLLSWSTMAAETVDGSLGNSLGTSLANMSKADIVRGIVSEKMTTAAREILVVVERIVAGYEEEASGFKQEIDRQRRQLELLLQPQVKQETTDDEQLFPVCEPLPEEASGGGEEDEGQYKYEPSVEDSESLGLVVCYADEPEEEQRAERSSTEEHEHLTPLEFDTASRSSSPSVRPDRRSAGRRRISDRQEPVVLRIRILEDSEISVLSTNVFQKYPLQELQCPLGLQEADFLNLLRSTFPQLAADKPFDVFITNNSRRLQPLSVETLTPEQIYSSIRSTGHSALYIKLKAPNEPPVADKELHLSQTEDAAVDSPSSSNVITTNKNKQHKRFLSPRARSNRKKRVKRRPSEPQQNRVDLRVCILEDSEISVLSSGVFQKYPLQELQCPLGLQEADFLNLLRSTFPQLAADNPFDIFITNKGRRLQPLSVETLTPEQIYSSIRSTGQSALYIRLKNVSLNESSGYQTLQSVDEELQPAQTEAADSQTGHTRLLSPRVQSDRRSTGRRRISQPQTHVDLRIRVLEDSQISVLSTNVFQKYPLQELKCPLGLQETDFLNLLRSTFPQLAADKPFDVFTCDRNKRLQPLTVKTLTPAEIYSSIKSNGAGNSALYIRLKLEELKNNDAAAQFSASAADESSLFTRSSSPTVQSDKRSASRRRITEPQDHIDLQIRILDSQISVLSTNVFQKYPQQALQCPLGLQEADFLDLLKSTFPQLAADKPFDIFITDQSRRLQPLRVEKMTPEQIYSSIKSTGHSALYIRLKEQKETHHLHRQIDSPSTSDQTSLNTNSHNIQVEQTQEDMQIEEVTDFSTQPESAKDFMVLFESEAEGEGDDDWEKISVKTKRRIKRSGVKTKSRKSIPSSPKAPIEKSDVHLSCKVCSILRGSMNMLIKHAWSHVGDLQSVCGVCGEHSESAEKLRSHLQTHQKTHSCNFCGMYFISASGLKGHMARHRGEQTYGCKICRKEFFQKSALKNHSWVHVEDKPHKCELCDKSFISNLNLKVHMTKHTGEKLYHCSVCNKSVRSFESLSQHMKGHSGYAVQEKVFECDICNRKFHTKHQQQAHMKHHFRQKPFACSKCSKQFSARCSLATHMRIHTGEKPYKCPVCDMAFSQSHCVKRHLKTHAVEESMWMKS
ncbi:uncharacterized protein LOC122974068 isoform X3 [Scomber scombrus]|uniref:Uncharacterized protein LOC122974068 isoform X3 n=1 Tax=Scomber scombrus TaxID=13677 RepID=A0AAV1PTU2_SCOSC